MNLRNTIPFAVAFAACVFLGQSYGQTPAPKPPVAKPAAPKPAVVKPAVVVPKPAAVKPAAPAPEAVAAPAKPMVEVKPDDVIIEIGDLKITKAEYELLVSTLPEQVRQQANGPDKKKVAEQYADIRMLAATAKKQNLGADPKTAVQMAFQTENFLAGALVREMQGKLKVDEASIQKLYEEGKSRYEQIKARHILIRFTGSRVPVREGMKDLSKEESLAKAKEVKEKLTKENFAEMAKKESDDAGSGADGGSLGVFSKGQMVPQFETAAFALPVGTISDPVESPFGHHIILVDEHSNKKLEEVRGELEEQAKPEMLKKAIEDMRKSSNVKLNDNYFSN